MAAGLGVLTAARPAAADTHYVVVFGSPVAPYTNWATAATGLHQAVAEAADGDTVLLSNGVHNVPTNVVVTNAVEIRGFLGATNTIVRRSLTGAYRVFTLSNSAAVLDGLTITNGYAETGHAGGGVLMTNGLVRNCLIFGNSGGANISGAGIACLGSGVVQNCLFENNRQGDYNGAAVYIGAGARVENCVMRYNYGRRGSGAHVAGGTLRNCLIHDNQDALTVGGVYAQAGSRIENCTIVNNIGITCGGLMLNGAATSINNIVYFNSSGADANCSNMGSGWSYAHCCTLPAMPGASNTAADPQFANAAAKDFRLLAGSPCIDSGSNMPWMAAATDLDGRPRVAGAAVDMGAYEFSAGALVCNPIGAPPLVAYQSNRVSFTASVAGTNLTGLYYMWDFRNTGSYDTQGADKQTVTNLYGPGRYTVRLVVTNAAGEVASCVKTNYVKVGPAVVYVAKDGAHLEPFTNWPTAATNLHHAVAVASDGSTVLLTNGMYDLTNTLLITDGIRLTSVAGATNTHIVGKYSPPFRVLFVSHSNAVIDGLTLRNGLDYDGGGVYIASAGTVQHCVIASNRNQGNRSGAGVYMQSGGVLRNCVIHNNTMGDYNGGGVYLAGGGLVENCIIASNSAGYAGGVGNNGGIVRNCLIVSNRTSRPDSGGGVRVWTGGLMENCTVVCNTSPASCGGLRTDGGTVRNCIVWSNTAPLSANWSNALAGAVWEYTCAWPLPTGTGNIADEPRFLAWESNDFRLGAASPCVDKGTNQPWMAGAGDLGGNMRIIKRVVDMGAYERNSVCRGTIFIAPGLQP